MKQLMSRRRIDIITAAIFLAGAIILAMIPAFWPGILLVIGLSLAFRQYLVGRWYEMALSIVVFTTLFFSLWTQINWSVIIPVFMTIAGITLIFRECALSRHWLAEEKAEQLQRKIEDELHED